MKIFDKRPLCTILCIMLGGFVFFADLSVIFKIIALVSALIGIILLQFLLKKNPHRVIASLSLAAIMLSSLLSFIYFDCHFNVYNRYSDRVEIVARVTKSTNTDYGASTYLECESIDGKNSNHKLYAYIDKECAEFVDENTVIRFSAVLKDFLEDGDYQDRSYMRSMGYSAEAYDVSDFSIVGVSEPSLADKIAEYRINICEYIIANSGDEGGGLLCALLLGERGYLPFQANLSFKRCGLSHMLALSGLHLTIITFAISYVLSLLKIRKKPRKVIEIIFVIIYSILTGMPISVVRAALMHIIASVIFLCSAKSDSITSLSISVCIICCAMPYAIYDISLWLSAFATLGVLVYSELCGRTYVNGEVSIFKRILRGATGGIKVSLFAIGTTYLISTLSFGEMSLIGALATPIASLFITPFMYIGLIFLAVAFFTPFGVLVNAYGTFICYLIRLFSSLNGIYISAEFVLTVVLVSIFTISLLLFLVLDIKKKKIPLLVLLALYITTNVSSFTMNFILRSTDDAVYFCDTDDDYFLIRSQNKTYFIDASSGSLSDNYSAINHIRDDRITELSAYVFTLYTKNTLSSALKMASSIYIDEIYLPTPKTENETNIYRELEESLKGSYTNIKTYSVTETLSFGSYKAMFPYRSAYEDKSAFMIIDSDAYVTCYVSPGMLDDETKNVASEMIRMSNRLILGRHGKYNNKYFILKFDNIDEIVYPKEDVTIPNEMVYYYRNITLTPSVERSSLKR